MTGYNPLDEIPPIDGSLRYPPEPNGRYNIDPGSRRGTAIEYRSLPATLEEEAVAGGWLPGATPTCRADAPPLQRLYTIGMRGEPGYDDDPSPERPYTNRYSDSGPRIDVSEGNTTGYD